MKNTKSYDNNNLVFDGWEAEGGEYKKIVTGHQLPVFRQLANW